LGRFGRVFPLIIFLSPIRSDSYLTGVNTQFLLDSHPQDEIDAFLHLFTLDSPLPMSRSLRIHVMPRRKTITFLVSLTLFSASRMRVDFPVLPAPSSFSFNPLWCQSTSRDLPLGRVSPLFFRFFPFLCPARSRFLDQLSPLDLPLSYFESEPFPGATSTYFRLIPTEKVVFSFNPLLESLWIVLL